MGRAAANDLRRRHRIREIENDFRKNGASAVRQTPQAALTCFTITDLRATVRKCKSDGVYETTQQRLSDAHRPPSHHHSPPANAGALTTTTSSRRRLLSAARVLMPATRLSDAHYRGTRVKV